MSAHTPITFSLAEVRNGTGWARGLRFMVATPEAVAAAELLDACRALLTKRGAYSPINSHGCEVRLRSDCYAEGEAEPCPSCIARLVIARAEGRQS